MSLHSIPTVWLCSHFGISGALQSLLHARGLLNFVCDWVPNKMIFGLCSEFPSHSQAIKKLRNGYVQLQMSLNHRSALRSAPFSRMWILEGRVIRSRLAPLGFLWTGALSSWGNPFDLECTVFLGLFLKFKCLGSEGPRILCPSWDLSRENIWRQINV